MICASLASETDPPGRQGAQEDQEKERDVLVCSEHRKNMLQMLFR